jgi:sphingosine kinase
MIAKGYSAWMDLSLYHTHSKSYTSFLTFSWGIIADIDIESEILHFLGFLRMDVWGVWRVLNLRKYRAKFSYLPPRNQDQKAVSLPPLGEQLPENEGWICKEDDFVLFWASQVTHAGEQMFHAPNCKINDGIFNIFIVR